MIYSFYFLENRKIDLIDHVILYIEVGIPISMGRIKCDKHPGEHFDHACQFHMGFRSGLFQQKNIFCIPVQVEEMFYFLLWTSSTSLKESSTQHALMARQLGARKSPRTPPSGNQSVPEAPQFGSNVAPQTKPLRNGVKLGPKAIQVGGLI